MDTTSRTNDKKVASTVDKLMKLINKQKLNIPELLVMYGNLGYHLGASIAGISGKGPSLEELKHENYSNPTVDVGLMLQGLLITTWEEDYIKHPQLSKYRGNINQKGKGKIK